MKEKKLRPAIFGVAYSIDKKGTAEYIILKRKKHWKGWEFPKGKVERFELKRWAAKREVKEETGLKVLRVKKFNEKGKYYYRRKLKDRPKYKGQTYHLFAVKVKKGRIKVDDKEHYSGKWVNYEKAMKMLTWPDQKRCLKIVNEWINNN